MSNEAAESGNDDDDEGADYELEPPDADVIAAEERRGAEQVDAVKRAINIDAIYSDYEGRRDAEIIRSWIENFRLRFRVKHLFILTAVVAVLLTMARAGGSGIINAIVVTFIVGIVGVSLYLQWAEQKRQEEADRRRQQMYAERRASFGRGNVRSREILNADVVGAIIPPAEAPSGLPQFHLNIPPKQIVICIVAAVALLSLIAIAVGLHNAAMLCGLAALAGIIINAVGFEPPEVVFFCWWVVLVLYIFLSIFAAVWAGAAGA